MHADEHTIDGPVFGAFVAAVLKSGPEGQEAPDAAFDVSAVLLVLAERAGLDAGAATQDPPWSDRARGVGRSMTH